MKRTKIGLLTTNLQGGGAQKAIVLLSNYLSKYYDIDLIVFSNACPKYRAIENVNFIPLNINTKKFIFLKIINLILKYIRLSKLKKKANYYAMISFLPTPNLINILTKKNEFIIISERSYFSRRYKGFYGKISKFFVKRLYSKSNKIVVQTQDMKIDILNKLNIPVDKVKVINNMIMANNLISNKMKSNPMRINFLSVGRFVESKGHLHILSAFKDLIKHKKEVHLKIVGSGNFRDEIYKYVHKNNLQDYVTLKDFTDKIHNEYLNSDIFVLASLFEGFPNVLIEAMSYGLAIISSDCKSGPREILAKNKTSNQSIRTYLLEEHGVLTPDFYTIDKNICVAELRKAMFLLATDYELLNKYKNTSIKRSKDFEIDNIGKKWINLMEGLNNG